ncbi:MAG: alanine--tRNA ligase [Rickettsiales bacterium]
MPTTSDVRAQFLQFFDSKQHRVLPSSSLVPHNDPTLMFANAGMNQFKNIFTGNEKPLAPRVTTTQKVVRAGGKHNDLDNVGYTARHHTFFEMLGNFSFGDYFKEGAIEFAWELLTNIWQINPEKLCVTVYHTDDEAFALWKKIAGLPESRIIRIASDDNFWAMGDTGPCGPCSEIFYDHGAHIAGGPPGSPDADGDRFVEIWNLVFMQSDQKDADTRVNLPKPCIDTGMGLERITAVLQGVHDNYDTDLFKNLIAASVNFSKSNSAKSASHRVIADHLRSSSFLIADGVLPSNEGRGYVLRRIMRRAMRHAHMLGCRDPLMYKLVPTLVSEMGAAYPELTRAETAITETLKLEEERFKQTLDRGLKLLEEEKAKLFSSPPEGERASVASRGGDSPRVDALKSPPTKSAGGFDSPSGGELPGPATRPQFPGVVAFKLYDTFGFPLDLTQDILRGENIAVDLEGFTAAMDEQKAKARAAWKGSGQSATAGLWFDIKERVGATEFLGYAMDEAEAQVVAIVHGDAEVQSAAAGETVSVLLNQTPFYGESGGQIGDAGTFSANGTVIGLVTRTGKLLDGLIVHEVTLSASLKVGDSVQAHIAGDARRLIRANHSATHLLHAALREKLGEHVTQKGSLVTAERLRFDVTNPKAISRDELDAVEATVNHYVAQQSPATTKLMTQDEAIKSGAMALFGEKYGDEVRVLELGYREDTSFLHSPLAGESNRPLSDSVGGTAPQEAPHGFSQEKIPLPRKGGAKVPFSVELCGGTHVANTGDIGAFKIVSEGSVSSGVRRIEAVTGEGVRVYLLEQLEKLSAQMQGLIGENTRLRGELKQPASAAISAPDTAALHTASLAQVPALYADQSAKAAAPIASLAEENKKLAKQLESAKKQAAMDGAGGEADVETIGSIKLASKHFGELDAKSLRDLAQALQQKHGDCVVVALSTTEGKANIIIAIGKEIQGKVAAPDLVKVAVEAVGGKGGGGRPEFAQGGGPDGDKLDAALLAVKAALAL